MDDTSGDLWWTPRVKESRCRELQRTECGTLHELARRGAEQVLKPLRAEIIAIGYAVAPYGADTDKHVVRCLDRSYAAVISHCYLW